MSRNFNPFKKSYNLKTFGDAATTPIRSQYELANLKKQLLKFEHIASGQKISFQAFLDSYSESYASNYNSTDVFGRMDSIKTFQNTKRTLTLGWVLASNSYDESEENLLRCQRLVQMLYPVYEDLYGEAGISATAMKAPPLVRVKLMNLVRDVSTKKDSPRGFEDGSGIGLIVTISSLGYNPDISNGTFDDPRPGVAFPKIIRLSMQCEVMHSHPLGFVQRGKNVAPSVPIFPFGVPDSESEKALDELQKTPITKPPRASTKEEPTKSTITKARQKRIIEKRAPRATPRAPKKPPQKIKKIYKSPTTKTT